MGNLSTFKVFDATWTALVEDVSDHFELLCVVYKITSLILFLLYQKPVELEHIIPPQSIIRRSRSFYKRSFR